MSGNQIHDTLCMRPAGARFELLISEFVQGDGPFCVICCPACEAIATERMLHRGSLTVLIDDPGTAVC